MSGIEERGYRSMVEAQGDPQIDTWAADLFIDFAKRLGVGTAVAAFCNVTGMGEDAITKPERRLGRNQDRVFLEEPVIW